MSTMSSSPVKRSSTGFQSGGPLEDVDSFERRPGGAPANVAVALARLERPPLFWTRVGADPFGRYLERILENNGLPFGSSSAIRVRRRRSRSSPTTRPASARSPSTGTEPPTRALSPAGSTTRRWPTASGSTLAASPSSGPSRAATLDLLERAAAAGCTVSFDPNLRPALWPNLETFASVVATRSLTSTSVSRRRRSSRRSVLMVGHRPNTRGQRSKADRSTPSS